PNAFVDQAVKFGEFGRVGAADLAFDGSSFPGCRCWLCFTRHIFSRLKFQKTMCNMPKHAAIPPVAQCHWCEQGSNSCEHEADNNDMNDADGESAHSKNASTIWQHEP